MKFSICNLGCKVNNYEANWYSQQLSEKYHIKLPIIEQVNAVLFQGKDPAQAVSELMLRDRKTEITDAEWDSNI